MINSFSYNGKSSRDFGILITERPNIYGSPSADIEAVSVPGRNGDLLFDNKRFENYELVYRCGILGNNADKMRRIKAWLNQKRGYAELCDSFTPGYFRRAAFMSPIDDNNQKSLTEFEINFNCQPFLYSYIGLQSIAITSEKTSKNVKKNITNPEMFVSCPLVKIKKYDSAQVKIGVTGIDCEYNKAIVCSGSGEYIIDTDIQCCYDIDGQQCNSKIDNANLVFPSGTLKITTLAAGEYELSVIPRWRTL